MKNPNARDTRIPRRPLLWLAAALLFTLPPMFQALAVWIPVVFLIALAAKFWMEPRGYRLRSTIWKLTLTAIVLVAVFSSYSSIKGIEPGTSLIVLLMSVKILEAHTAREFHIMVLVGWVLCLCGFFLSQDLAIAICLLTAFALLLVALVQFHRGAAASFWAPIFSGAKLLAQAVPVIVLLFLFFPRFTTAMRFQIAQPRGGAAGFSGQLSPGTVASLAGSSEVAFRAEFPDGKIPPLGSMYWRGVVMWQCNGLEWQAPVAPAALPRNSARPSTGEGVRQWITIEAHDAHWMFALDWPAGPPPGATIAPGNYLWSGQLIRKTRRYEVISIPKIVNKGLHDRERKMALEVPPNVSPAAVALVQSWKTKSTDTRALVVSALEFFRTQGFRYTLSPGEYRKNDLDEFLFRRRTGFCEHYAAAFATLMRMAGVPARVVTGYLGGEYNEIGGFFVVRQADAHAWCEVWSAEAGWQRVDPTSVVAPDRINLGLNSFLERAAASNRSANGGGALARNLKRWPLFAKGRLVWQTLNYVWDTRVLSFDTDAQESLFGAIGWGDRGPLLPILAISFVIVAILAAYASWSRLRTRPARDQVAYLYGQFCRHAARVGIPRNPTEGPMAFRDRASQLMPNESEQLRRISDNYISLRYANEADPILLDQFARDVETFGRARARSL